MKYLLPLLLTLALHAEDFYIPNYDSYQTQDMSQDSYVQNYNMLEDNYIQTIDPNADSYIQNYDLTQDNYYQTSDSNQPLYLEFQH